MLMHAGRKPKEKTFFMLPRTFPKQPSWKPSFITTNRPPPPCWKPMLAALCLLASPVDRRGSWGENARYVKSGYGICIPCWLSGGKHLSTQIWGRSFKILPHMQMDGEKNMFFVLSIIHFSDMFWMFLPSLLSWKSTTSTKLITGDVRVLLSLSL